MTGRGSPHFASILILKDAPSKFRLGGDFDFCSSPFSRVPLLRSRVALFLRVLSARMGFHGCMPHGVLTLDYGVLRSWVLTLILGGAAVHRCDRRLVARIGFSRCGENVGWKVLFQPPDKLSS
jgi:hypothetical protein